MGVLLRFAKSRDLGFSRNALGQVYGFLGMIRKKCIVIQALSTSKIAS